MPTVPDTEANAEACICGQCPTDPGEGVLYCARGASAGPVNERGCICGDCSVYREHGLRAGFYCSQGAA